MLAGKLKDLTSAHRLREYAEGDKLFLAIQTEANRNALATMWRRVATSVHGLTRAAALRGVATWGYHALRHRGRPP